MRTVGGFWSVLLSFWAALIFCTAYAGFGYFAISSLVNVETAFDSVRLLIGVE